eukprot:1195380-Prorocentrum_minimum.AAC.7
MSLSGAAAVRAGGGGRPTSQRGRGVPRACGHLPRGGAELPLLRRLRLSERHRRGGRVRP